MFEFYDPLPLLCVSENCISITTVRLVAAECVSLAVNKLLYFSTNKPQYLKICNDATLPKDALFCTGQHIATWYISHLVNKGEVLNPISPGALMWHLARRGLYYCLMPDCAWRCRTSTLIMVPINFWRNSDPFKKKSILITQKLTKLEHFL